MITINLYNFLIIYNFYKLCELPKLFLYDYFKERKILKYFY